MPAYFRWEGVDDDGRGKFCQGVIDGFPSCYTCHDIDTLTERIAARGVKLVWWEAIDRSEYERRRTECEKRDKLAVIKKRPFARMACGAIGLAGCSAATILLPMPVAIWAATAFAALTVAAAAPP